MTVPGKGGPPSKIERIDPEKLKVALGLAREGIWKEVIAGALGISVDTLDRWIDAAPDDPVLGAFASRFHQANAIAIVESTRRSRKGTQRARSEQWFSERRWPTLLGNRQKHDVEHSGPKGGPIPVATAVIFVPPETPDDDSGGGSSGSGGGPPPAP